MSEQFVLTDEDREMMRQHPIVASVSGGKDSTALALWLKEQGLDFRAVFMNTGWEHEDTYTYLKELERYIGEIHWIEPPLHFADLVRKKGMFPGRIFRYCTQQLKIYPLLHWIEEAYAETPVLINAVGIRAEESARRAKMSRWSEWMDNTRVWVWRPLLDWKEEAVMDIHQRHGIPPNPLYLRKSSRVGCWPCIFARKAEIRAVADETPERIDEIRELEAEVQELARQRYAARGETFESLGYKPPTFFDRPWAKGGGIDTYVKWAKTSHGGRQYDMFGVEEGCVRWGLCET